MGSYLSAPVTEKISTDTGNDKLVYGASSMQGWRVSQEDAHNSILDYDENTAFFAVYDGHGGHEVAQYCAQKLPEFIKQTEAYKNGDFKQALIEGFLGFDASIARPEVVAVLKEIAGEKEAEEDSDDEENVLNLYEEASMPIEKVIEKYTNLVNPTLKNLKKREKLPKSPMISAKKDNSVALASSSSTEAAGSSKDFQEEGTGNVVEAEGSSNADSSHNEAVSSSTKVEVNGDGDKKEESIKELEETKPASNGSIPDADSSETKEAASAGDNVDDNNEKKETITQNGDIAIEKNEEENKDKVSSSVDGEVVCNKAKGKSPMKKSPKTPPKTRPKRKSAQLYKKLLDFGSEEEDTEDEEDKTFVGPGEESSDEENLNVSVEEGGSEEESSDGDDEEEEEEEEDQELDEEDEDDLEFARNMKEEPGSDSGCTAVIAVLNGCELYVANAGDSRCIVCRNGKAFDMSVDHKPEDEPERNRIVNAGGKVTADGRVNGGLNLSRAIGDHAYKQNKDLSNKEQMITALPDVMKLTINPSEDEFMVLACDGIWNFMSSQEVVDFVKPRIEENADKISHICEEMFDHCLAPNTMGDGTGCDNMTAIIVRFKPNLKKRSFSPETTNPDDASSDSKRAKTEVDGQPSETSS